jgi:hypothetical protein
MRVCAFNLEQNTEIGPEYKPVKLVPKGTKIKHPEVTKFSVRRG